jgi:predicted nucleic acid-binding protein
VHPLRKDFDVRSELPPFQGDRHQFREVEGEGVVQVPVGPVHAGIIEPGHFLLEVAAGLERAQRAGRMAMGDTRGALDALEVVFVDRTDPFAAAATSLALAFELGIRVADAAYLECAQRASTTLVTADRRLARACARSGVPVVALADMPPR